MKDLKEKKQYRIFVFVTICLLAAILAFTSKLKINAAGQDVINFTGKIINVSDNTNIESTGTTCINDGGSDTCDFRLSLYSASSGGTLLFQETYVDIEIGDNDGIFQFSINSICDSWVALGSPPSNCTASPTVAGVDWSTAPTLYVQIEFDNDGNGDFSSPEVFSRKLLSANAFAYNSTYANNLSGYTDTELLKLQPGTTQSINATTADEIIFLNETGSGSPAFIQLQQAGTDVFTVANNGRVSIGTGTDALLDIKAATTGSAQINLTSSGGVDVTSLVSGDLWFNGTQLNFYDGTATTDLLSASSNLFTDSGATTYLTSTSDDLAIGGTTIANSVFGIDVNLGDYYFGSAGTVDPSLIFESTNELSASLNFNSTGDFTFEVDEGTFPTENWYDVNWGYRKMITINSAEIDSTLTNFPVYVDLNDLGTDFFTNVKSDGSDIVVTSSDGTTKLSRELVSINTGSESGELWFNAPSISSSADTDFYIYYGYASASETNSELTWDSQYEVVQHLNEDPSGSAPQAIDSTSNSLDGTSGGTMLTEDLVTGQIGQAIDFDGSDDYISLGTDVLQQANNYTVSAWVNADNAAGALQQVFGAFGRRWGLTLETGDFNFHKYDGSLQTVFDTATNNEWYHMVGQQSSTAGMNLYLNGVSVDVDADTSSTIYQSGPTLIGNDSNGYNKQFDGRIDEVRFVDGVLTSDWIASEYSNQSDTATFYSIGEQIPQINDVSDSIGFIGINTDDPQYEVDVVGNIQLSGDLLPETDDTSDIGTNVNPFANLYADTLNATNTIYLGNIYLSGDLLANSAPTETVNTAIEHVGTHSSSYVYHSTDIAINQDGLPVISAYNTFNETIDIVYCDTADCSGTNNVESYATSASGDYETSIVINSDNYPVVSFHDTTGGDLEVVGCADEMCTSATIYPLDIDNAGRYSDMAIGIDGNPIIVSQHGPDDRLEITSCTAIDCSTNSASIILDDSSTNVGRNPSIAIRPNGTPFIAYHDETNGDLKIYICQSTTCSAGNSSTLLDADDFPDINDIGEHPQVIIGSQGYPIIALQDITNGHLYLVVCKDYNCGEFSLQNLQYQTGVNGIVNPGWGTYSAGWYDANWAYRKEITAPAANVSGSADHTDFPLFFELSALGDHFFDNVKSDGTDIVITTSGGVKLDRELVEMDTSAQTGEIWFRDPSLDYDTDNTYYIYYGNSSGAESNSTGVWSSQYALVMHMNEDPSVSSDGPCGGGSDDLCDSTANLNNAVDIGGSTLITGILGNATDFDGVNDYLRADYDTSLVPNNITASVWFRPDGTDDVSYEKFLFMPYRDAASSYPHHSYALGQFSTSGNPQCELTVSGANYAVRYTASAVMDVQAWFNITLTYDGETIRCFVNGNEATPNTTPSGNIDYSGTGTPDLFIGGKGDNDLSEYAEGDIDEVRILDNAKSADWINTEYDNQVDPDTFFTVSSNSHIEYNVGQQYDSNNIAVSGTDMSIAKKIDGSPVIAYYNDSRETLNLFECSNSICTDGINNEITDSGDNIGYDPGIARLPGSNAEFITSYFNADDEGLDTATFSKSYSGGISLGTSSNYFGAVYTAKIYSKSAAISNFDVAEEYFVEDKSINAGDVVRFKKDSKNDLIVERTDSSYDEGVIGVISTEPGLYLKGWEDQSVNGRPVALVGRVPVKVTDENGPIKRGDFLTASLTPGYAMKASSEGYIIGRAMEDFNPASLENADSILVKEHLKTERAEAEKILEGFKESKARGGLSDEELDKVDRNIETYKKQIEEVTKQISIDQGRDKARGRIMMYVDLRYASDENYSESELLSGAFENSDAALNNLDASQLLVNFLDIDNEKITVSVEDLVVIGNVAINGDLDVGGLLKAENAEFESTEILNALQIAEDSPYTGKITLEAGSTSIEIDSEVVNSKSQVLISISSPVNYAISSIKDGKSFIFEIDKPINEDLYIEYLILE